MAKARGNKLVPPANYARNPMAIDARRLQISPPTSMGVSQRGRTAPLPPDAFGVYGQSQPFFVQGTDQRTGQTVTSPISGRQFAAFNNPFDYEGQLEPSNGGSIAPVADRPSPRANYTRNPMGSPPNQGPVKPYRFDPNLGGREQLARYAEYARSYGQSPYDPSMSETSNEILFGKNPQNIGIQQGLPTPRANYTRNPMQNMGGPSPRATYRGSPLGPNPLGEQVRETIDRNSPSVRVRPGWLDEPIPLATPGVPQRTAPSVNIWNGGAMQRSPSPMTYADPSNDPNIGMYDLARQVDALRERSQTKFPSNPMSPTYGVVNPDAESARRLAPMMARDAARQQNTPMNGMTAYEANPMRYRPGDPAIQARQQDNAQRATMGRPMDRTRDGGALNDYIASGGTPWYEREKQARDQMAMQARQSTPEFQAAMAAMQQQKTAREALRDRSLPPATPEEADRRARANALKAQNAAKHEAFKQATGGMNYRQYDRLQNQNALTMKAVREGRLSPQEATLRMQTRADKALRRAGNPMAMSVANGGRLFPDLMAGRGGRAATPNQNPMVSGRTLEAQQAAAADIVNREATSPHIAGLGVEPGSGLAGLNQKISSRIQEDPNAEFSDESLKEFQQHAAQYETIATDQNDPFAFGTGQYGMDAGVESKQANLWRELAKLPDNPRSRAEWLKKYKAVKPDAEPDMMDPANQQPSPFQSPEKPMYRGGNPMYTPRLPIRTGV